MPRVLKEEEDRQTGWRRESKGVGDEIVELIGSWGMRTSGTQETIIKYLVFTLREIGTIAGS